MPRDAQVRCVPSSDRAFAAHVELARERVGQWDADLVLNRVREAYPNAAVVRADPFAILEIDADLWYVYRDGAARSRPLEIGWADADDVARMVIGPDGRYLEANGQAAALFGVAPDQIIGRPAGEFTRHEADDDLGRRLLGLARDRSLTSTAVVLRPDGEEWPVDFSISSRDGGGYIVAMRPTEPVPA